MKKRTSMKTLPALPMLSGSAPGFARDMQAIMLPGLSDFCRRYRPVQQGVIPGAGVNLSQ